ncbi:hypothetical protein VTO42DRAFT_5401 [Malbranchea cinnamomea]
MPSKKTKDDRAHDRLRDRDSEDESGRHSTTRRADGRHRRASHGSIKRSSTTAKDKDDRRPRSDRRSTSSTASSREKGSDVTARPPSASLVLESRSSLPYPSFSKAHSKEAVGSRDSLGIKFNSNTDSNNKTNVLTPEPTDITVDGERQKPKRHSTREPDHEHARPPSPPLTHDDEPLRTRRSTPSSTGKSHHEEKGGSATTSRRSHEEEIKHHRRPRSSRSSTSSLKKTAEQLSRSSTKSQRPGTPAKFKILDAFQLPLRPSSPQQSPKPRSHEKEGSRRASAQHRPQISPRTSSITERSSAAKSVGESSDATYVASHQPKYSQPSVHVSGPSAKRHSTSSSQTPPPPPPPVDVPATIPRVDYLLQYGGLGHHVPRNFLGAGESANVPQEYFRPELVGAKLFEPFSRLLDDYGQVMKKNGSLAVATGYRSVARRLLDRLEAVFARDISSETCTCFMCYREGEEYPEDVSTGVSWGEVLELVSGRQELPAWPPFSIGSETPDIPPGQSQAPMQKLDVDIPKEYREHYIQQSKKTKDAVDKWLSRQPNQTTSPPDDFDDDTLAFVILTYLDEERREAFKELLEIPKTPPAPKTETPKPVKERPQTIVLGSLALQRLYRLARPPRDPETAIYMVNNPDMHHVLATLAAISNDEWDILTSGRFDGFLRSGAEDGEDLAISSSTQLPSYCHGSTNGRASRTSMRSTPASFGAPISIDEETEIATLAEIERDIFLGMEALEDAFEALHCKAEAIRRAIRERGAGLTAARARRNSAFNGGGVEVLTRTPDLAGTVDTVTDDGLDDGMSEIAPSDSASNISSNRRRRPKRRTERRTPAAVEEEEEEG